MQVETAAEGLIVLNRNWGPGWTADPPHEAISSDGLISARVAPGSQTITFRYRPVIVAVGGVVSLLTAVASATLVLWERRRTGTCSARQPAATEAVEASRSRERS